MVSLEKVLEQNKVKKQNKMKEIFKHTFVQSEPKPSKFFVFTGRLLPGERYIQDLHSIGLDIYTRNTPYGDYYDQGSIYYTEQELIDFIYSLRKIVEVDVDYVFIDVYNDDFKILKQKIYEIMDFNQDQE